MNALREAAALVSMHGSSSPATGRSDKFYRSDNQCLQVMRFSLMQLLTSLQPAVVFLPVAARYHIWQHNPDALAVVAAPQLCFAPVFASCDVHAVQLQVVMRCPSVLQNAEDLVLKQALVKFCTQLELASAFMHKVGNTGIQAVDHWSSSYHVDMGMHTTCVCTTFHMIGAGFASANAHDLL